MNCANQNLNELFSVGQWEALAKDNADALDTVMYVPRLRFGRRFDGRKGCARSAAIVMNVSCFDCDRFRFDNNGISNITEFPKLNVKSLSFRNNKISSIAPKAFLKLGTLRSLDISFNKLTSAALKPNVFQGPYDPSVYEPLTNMSFLSLANNDIHTLDPDLFEHFPNLEALSLSHNPFKIIDPNTAIAISTLHNLKTLDLSDMELSELPEQLLHAPRELKVLNMSGNLFEALPETLQYAINLEELNLDDNNIVAIGGNA